MDGMIAVAYFPSSLLSPPGRHNYGKSKKFPESSKISNKQRQSFNSLNQRGCCIIEAF
jgi:hypothetical protein